MNKSVFSILRQLTTWHCPHPAAARRCWAPSMQQLVDICCLPGSQQQTRSGGRMGQTVRQTDGGTPDSFKDPAPLTMQAAPITIRYICVPLCCKPWQLRSTSIRSHRAYKVGQKSKLLILSEYVNKTEKIRGMWTNTNILNRWIFSKVTSKSVIVSCTSALGQHTAKRRRKCTKQSRYCL